MEALARLEARALLAHLALGQPGDLALQDALTVQGVRLAGDERPGQALLQDLAALPRQHDDPDEVERRKGVIGGGTARFVVRF